MKTVSAEKVRQIRYRAQFLDQDRRQMMIVIALSTVGIGLTIRNDLVLLKGLSSFYHLLLARCLHLIVTAGTIITLRNAGSLRRYERACALWNVTTTALFIAIGLSRLPVHELQGPFLGAIAALNIFYFAQRGPLHSRIFAGGTITILFFHRLLNPNANISSTGRTTGVILLVLLNAIGIATSLSFEQQRRKRYEAERQERRTRLELLAKNRDLAAQKEQAEALSRSRAAFLAAMSHEFRTPMNAVIGLSDVLVNAQLSAEHREYARTIQDSARALLSLLNDILDFSKIDAGKLALSPTTFDLRGLLGSIVDMMQPAADAKNIELVKQFDPDLPDHVVADDARIRQVLVNLLSNAIKFTSTGSVTFSVSSKRGNKGEYSLDFSVQDTGVGMTPEVIARLFRPFEQGDEGIGRRFGGTGLGLAISRQIITAMGGDIIVTSEVGKGSRFSFQLQFMEASSPVPFALSGIRSPSRNAESLAILVVDDLPINLTVARVMLERLGYKPDFARDGYEAVECVKKKDYDLVFMDLQMPGMDGIETTKCINEALVNKHRPRIVAMSASVFEEDRAACRAAGMHDFVAKPIDIEALSNILKRFLGQKERASTAKKSVKARAPEPRVTAAVLDPIPLAKLGELEAMGEPGFVAELCRDFLRDTPPRIERMKEQLRDREWENLGREAHSLKSSSASLGAMDMSKICATIEANVRQGHTNELDGLLERLASEMPRVDQALKSNFLN